MARNTKALILAISVMSLNNLYECGPINGYKFPVYTTPSCPKNEAEWLERSSVLNCTDQNGYMCIPKEMITGLVEFCYTKKVAIPEGYCLILKKRSSAVDAYECHHFAYGCPSYPYFSNQIYKHQRCVSIADGCFLADPYCRRTVTANRKTTTSKYNTEEGIGTNSITTGTPYSTFLIIIIVTIISLLIAGQCLLIVGTRITRRCSEGSTGHASDPTTEISIPDKIQDTSLEGPRVEMADGALNELNADFKDGNVETKVTLSKTRAQQDGPLKGQKFSNHSSTIKTNSKITSTCVSVRLPLNGELFGYDVETPIDHQIDANKTVITPKNDVIEIKIVKISEFTFLLSLECQDLIQEL